MINGRLKLSSLDSKMNKDNNKLSVIFWVFFSLFGGWNGVQLALQPQDILVFFREDTFLNSIYLTLLSFRENLPLMLFFITSIFIVWQYISVKLDSQMISRYNSSSFYCSLKKEDRFNLNISLTFISIIIWGISFWFLSTISLLTKYSVLNIFDVNSTENTIIQSLHIVIVSLTCALVLFIRQNTMIFASNGSVGESITSFYRAFKKHTVLYVRVFLTSLLMIILSSLVYKWLIIGILYRMKIALFPTFGIKINTIITGNDFLLESPKLILAFLISSILLFPLVILGYKMLLKYQIEIFNSYMYEEKIDNFVDLNEEDLINNTENKNMEEI